MLARLGVLLSAVLLIGSCSTVGLTSPYAKLGTKEVYEYGTFCGPRLPVTDLPRLSDEKRDFLLATPAQDSIDMACKIHDVCYENFGHDNYFCDRALVAYLQPGFNGIRIPPRTPLEVSVSDKLSYNWRLPTKTSFHSGCEALGREIANAMDLKLSVFSPLGASIDQTAKLGAAISVLPLTILSNRMSSFPKEAGTCSLSNRGRAAASSLAAYEFARAAVVQQCGCQSETSPIEIGLVDVIESSCASECISASIIRANALTDKMLGRQALVEAFGMNAVDAWVEQGALP